MFDLIDDNGTNFQLKKIENFLGDYLLQFFNWIG